VAVTGKLDTFVLKVSKAVPLKETYFQVAVDASGFLA